MSTAEDHKKKRTRSPAYPAYGLEDSISKAHLLYKQEDRHPVPVEVAMQHWGYKSTSSGGIQSISSLKQFGLLDEDGGSANREVRLSQLALTILLHENDSEERAEAIRIAALNPKIHREMWDKYSGKLPSDASIKVYLTLNREQGVFNKDAVDGFIEQFRATIEYAQLTDFDKIQDKPTGDQQPKANPPDDDEVQPSRHDRKKRTVATGSKQDVYTLEEGDVILEWPTGLSKDSVADIEDWLGLMIRKLKRSVKSETGDVADE